MSEKRQRTEEELRGALQRFINREQVMTIPVDMEHDADIIISDGISELISLREEIRLASEALEGCWDLINRYRQEREAKHDQ